MRASNAKPGCVWSSAASAHSGGHNRSASLKRSDSILEAGGQDEGLHRQDEIPEILRREARSGDVLLLMSSGAFGGLPETLLEEL